MLGEATELVFMGSEEPLREPMRPIRGTTRVLLIDGVGGGEGDAAVVHDEQEVIRVASRIV